MDEFTSRIGPHVLARLLSTSSVRVWGAKHTDIRYLKFNLESVPGITVPFFYLVHSAIREYYPAGVFDTC